jgi:16S rRNA (cytosine967-C5)-methyltransferase
MHPSREAAQARIFLKMLGELRAHWERDRSLPERLRRLLADKRFGSRDRRLYREWAYTALRHALWLGPLFDRSPEQAVAAVLALGLSPHAPPLDDIDAVVPAWFAKEAPAACTTASLRALLTRPPLWLRSRAPVADVIAALSSEGVACSPSLVVPSALRVEGSPDLTHSEAFAAGLFEVQDAGSQRVLEAVRPRGRWLDACAGAGGKTLHLADLLGADGHVDAWEPRPAAREELLRRAERARIQRITLLGTSPAGRPTDYDGVLVDAPCSGSGTWRRTPHLKLCTRPEDIAEAAIKQLKILLDYAPLSRLGGEVIYATCSLCRSENEGVIEAFQSAKSGFTLLGATTHLPHTHDGDGFFVARLRRVG